ncbi:MAG: hypothetical protein KBD62_35135 [Kofleriaceae bacterium]|nr:hypothetical protein [Kofleriaceae bacterium]
MSFKSWLLGEDAAKRDPSIQGANTGYATDAIKNALGTVGNRAAPQAGGVQLGNAAQVDPTQQAQFRAGQMQQIGQLQGIASGQQQGAGEMAVNRQLAQALAAQHSAAASARGANSMLAGRDMARNAANLGIAGAGQAQQAAQGDQMQAQGMLAQALGQGRGQDLSLAGQNAGFNQERMMGQGQLDSATQLANLHAQLTQTGMNDQAALAYMAQLLGMDEANLRAQLGEQSIMAGQRKDGFLGDALQAGGGLMAGYGALTGGGKK